MSPIRDCADGNMRHLVVVRCALLKAWSNCTRNSCNGWVQIRSSVVDHDLAVLFLISLNYEFLWTSRCNNAADAIQPLITLANAVVLPCHVVVAV